MSGQGIDIRSPPLRAAAGIQRVGTATDRRSSRQDAEDKRKDGDGSRKRRHLYDLLFEEIDQVHELETHQRERLKRNIRAHLALRARDQTPLPTVIDRDEPLVESPERDAGAGRKPPPPASPAAHLSPEDEAQRLIDVAAPLSPELPPEELELNAQLAAQLRDCLERNTDTARKVAAYLRLLLSIDGALAPHLIIEI